MSEHTLFGIFQEIMGLIIIFSIAGAIAGCFLIAQKIPESVRISNENKSTVQRDFYGTNENATSDRNGMGQYDGVLSAEEVESEIRNILLNSTTAVYVNGRLLNGRAMGNNIPIEIYMEEYNKGALFSSHVLTSGKTYSRTYGTDSGGQIIYVLYQII